jgi:alpha-N-arabinofuranosidase
VSYLLPVASVMRLFQRHRGTHGILLKSSHANLDISASRSANKVFLHVANTHYSNSVNATFAVNGMRIHGGKVYEISPENPRQEISPINPTVFKPREAEIGKDAATWRFPARSVSAVELDCS